MKKYLTIAILLLLALTINARTYVLIAGVSNYQGTENDLQQSTKDAKAFYKVMKTQTNDITIVTSRNATTDNVKNKLTKIAQTANSNDRIIFFYAGHGTPGSICLYDKFLSYREIVTIMKACKAKEKLLIVDACHAGSVATDDGYRLNGNDGIVCLMACRPDEYSNENPLLGAGYFTQGLIKGLRGKADDNHDKNVTIYELFKYAHADVVKRSKDKQHPQYIGPKDCFDSIIARW